MEPFFSWLHKGQLPLIGASLESFFRKIPVSVKFLSAVLRPEMAAPILWTPGKNAFFLQEKPHVRKIPPFRGGFFGGGVPILFLWARGFF